MTVTTPQQSITRLIAPSAEELGALRILAAALDAQPQLRAQLTGPDGLAIPIPPTALLALGQIVQALAAGQAITILPYPKQLTTQEAADLLQVSRQYLVRLLDAGELPYDRVGTHRRLRLQDVLEYGERRSQQARAGLRQLTELSDELGLYDISYDEIAPLDPVTRNDDIASYPTAISKTVASCGGKSVTTS